VASLVASGVAGARNESPPHAVHSAVAPTTGGDAAGAVEGTAMPPPGVMTAPPADEASPPRGMTSVGGMQDAAIDAASDGLVSHVTVALSSKSGAVRTLEAESTLGLGESESSCRASSSTCARKH